MTTSPHDRSSTADPTDGPALAPLLVVGAPRSGTTMVQAALLDDPRCAGGQESHILAQFGPLLREFDRKLGMPRPHGLGCYWTRDDLVRRLRALWRDTFEPVLAARPGATLLVEKTPDHALWLDVAAELLPRGRVVHVVRDSRAVVASLLRASRSPWGSPWAPRSVDAAIEVWRRHTEAALASPLPVHRVRYEDMVHRPSLELDAMLDFVGLTPLSDRQVRSSQPRTTRFVGGGAVGTPPPEPEGFARDADQARDGWMSELGWWTRRRIWTRTADLMQRLGYSCSGRAVGP